MAHRKDDGRATVLVDGGDALHDAYADAGRDIDRYRAMVDGRAIHFFFQLIEPNLVRLYPGMVVGKTQGRPGQSVADAFSPRRLAAIHMAAVGSPPTSKTLRRRPPVVIDVYGDPSPMLLDAVDAIDRAALAFFLDLAVGSIIMEDGPAVSICCARVPSEQAATVAAFAGRLMAEAAACFFRVWLAAELCAQGRGETNHPAASEAALLFGRCVAIELADRDSELASADFGRESEILPSPRTMTEWLDLLSNVPLTRELLACWYPRWERARVIFDSPFNTVRDLRSFFRVTESALAAAGPPDAIPALTPACGRAAITRRGKARLRLGSSRALPFLALEGCDGVGKSTIRDFLAAAFAQEGLPVTVVGQHSWLDLWTTRLIVEVREQRRPHERLAIAEAYFQDKTLHARRNIITAARTSLVMADRYLLSDAVYLEALYGVPAAETLARHFAAGTPTPAVIIHVVLDVDEAVRRIARRSKQTQHYERPVDLRRIAAIYRRVLHEESGLALPPVITFDNTSLQLEKRVHSQLMPALLAALPIDTV